MQLPDPESNLEVDSLSNYDAIRLARGCVERGDIAQAVRYLTLLRGQSANVTKVRVVSRPPYLISLIFL